MARERVVGGPANRLASCRDWWFASTAIPLMAAALGPLANVMSIAALVTSWRMNYDPNYPGVDDQAIGYPDPHW
jgi:potassium channel subfamily K, other eukaryote